METKGEKENRQKRMSITLGANLFSTIYAGVGYLFGGNTVFSGEFKHSGTDSIVYGSRLYAEHQGYNQETRKFRNFLRVTMAVPAAFLLKDSYDAAIDIFSLSDISQDVGFTGYVGAIVISSSNTVAYVASNSIKEHSHASKANLSHAIADLGASYAYAGGLILEASDLFDGGSTYGTAVGSGIAGAHLAYEAIKPHKHSHIKGNPHEH
jgi:hypothetical protein